MYRLRVLLLVVVIYFGGHVINSAVYCSRNFCPGDREEDWIYEYVDDDTGKKMIMVDGKSISKADWLKSLQEEKRQNNESK